MKKIIVFFYALTLIVHNCYAEEFIYPIAQIDAKTILVVHQQSLEDLKLFLWNIESKVATKELNSMFFPAHIKILPSKQGFSFIDRGRIRLKMFQKRTPKAIDVLEPIGTFISMHWINDDLFFGVGKHLQNYNVFLYDLSKKEKPLYQLTDFDATNYLYPYKVEDSLFCITKDDSQFYYVIEQSWSPTIFGEPREPNAKKILFISPEPLCFLHMIDKKEGYFLKCNILDANIQTDTFLSFSCFHCVQNNEKETWMTSRLFSFKLPKNHITGLSEQRVYESIYPFLPNYTHEKFIYFVDYDEITKKLVGFVYDKELGTIAPVFHKRSMHDCLGFLSPLVLSDSICYGIILSSTKISRTIIHLDQETGMFNIDLPIVF